MATVLWSVIEEEIRDLVNADVFEEGNKYHKYLLRWGNRTQREIAQIVNIREHLITDGTNVTLTTSLYYASLPADFFKISDRFTTVRLDEDYIDIIPLETLASYDINDNEVKVLGKNRSLPDIIRSVAHELVHHKQNERGELTGREEEGADGSPWEDQANALAGELVRKYGRENPEIYDI